MSVKVGKLWTNSKFSSLSINSKLFYIYLSTTPDINSVGVCCVDIRVVSIQLGLSIDLLRKSMLELVDNNFILCDKVEGLLYFTVLAHFNTLPKSDTTVMQVTKDLKALPKQLVKKLSAYGISTDRKAIIFKEPSAEEVSDYAFSQGYIIDGQEVVDFYRRHASMRGKQGVWLDSRGKQVKDWRSKLRMVWFTDDKKLKSVDGAPKGFEHFHIYIDGKMVFPESWKNGQPFSKNIAVNKQLKEEYEKRKTSS